MSQLLTPSTAEIPSDLSEPTIYSGLRAQSELHLIANNLSNRLLWASPTSVEEALAFNKALENWAVQLPSYFQLGQNQSSSGQWYLFARSRLWWRYWNFKIILFRPVLLRCAVEKLDPRSSYRPTPEEEECRQICLHSAHLTVESVKGFVDQYPMTRLAGWYCLHVTTFFQQI